MTLQWSPDTKLSCSQEHNSDLVHTEQLHYILKQTSLQSYWFMVHFIFF